MTLKNWKKISKFHNTFEYKKRTKSSWEIIWIGEFVDGYRVILSSPESKKTLIVKKTKPEAVKFAKAYMRKN